MKVLFIGDPHLKITRFELAKKFLTWLNTTIATTNPDLVVNLGDTFDTHAVVRSEIMAEFIAHVNFVRSLNIPYVYVLGNHDMYKPNDAKYHALLPFKETIDGFHVIDQVTDMFDMTFVPYQHNPTTFPTDTKEICVCHQTFKDASYGDITTKDGVDSERVTASVIVSGHIHRRQRCGWDNKVIYPGSPFSQSANDINQVKGLLLFETETYHETFLQCPLPTWKGLTFELSPSYDIEQLHAELESNINSTDHWVVEITGPRAEIIGYLDSKRAKKLFDGVDIKIKTHFTDREKRTVKIEAFSMEHIISEYVAKIYSGTIDKESLKNKALSVLETIRAK